MPKHVQSNAHGYSCVALLSSSVENQFSLAIWCTHHKCHMMIMFKGFLYFVARPAYICPFKLIFQLQAEIQTLDALLEKSSKPPLMVIDGMFVKASKN